MGIDYKDNMHIVDHILNELMICRTIQEIEEFEKAKSITYLKLFPFVNDKAEAVEFLFNDYCKDFNVKEWYESLFKIELTPYKK